MKIELACDVCGNNRFALSQATSDDAPVRCDDCGHEIGTLGSLKEEVARIVLSRAGRFASPPRRPAAAARRR